MTRDEQDASHGASSVPRRAILTGAAALIAAPALAQSVKPRVTVQTDKGPIVLELEIDRAPVTTGNFLRYVDTGRYDGSAIYRASRSKGAPEFGLIEGGLDDDSGKLLPPIAHESTAMTGLTHKDGTISLARYAPGTGASDFFICVGPSSYLDANPGAPGDNQGFAAFGQVIEGMEVVRLILDLPTTGVASNPVMQGQIIDPPVMVISMKRGG